TSTTRCPTTRTSTGWKTAAAPPSSSPPRAANGTCPCRGARMRWWPRTSPCRSNPERSYGGRAPGTWRCPNAKIGGAAGERDRRSDVCSSDLHLDHALSHDPDLERLEARGRSAVEQFAQGGV